MLPCLPLTRQFTLLSNSLASFLLKFFPLYLYLAFVTYSVCSLIQFSSSFLPFPWLHSHFPVLTPLYLLCSLLLFSSSFLSFSCLNSLFPAPPLRYPFCLLFSYSHLFFFFLPLIQLFFLFLIFFISCLPVPALLYLFSLLLFLPFILFSHASYPSLYPFFPPQLLNPLLSSVSIPLHFLDVFFRSHIFFPPLVLLFSPQFNSFLS